MANRGYHEEPDRALAFVTAERLRHIRTLFESIAELRPEDRLRVLDKSRQVDPTLVAEVEQLLAAHLRPDEFLDQPLAHPPLPLSEEAEPDLSGPRVGAYEGSREVGRGGMGTVYEAARVDGAFRKRVGIKVVRASLLTETLRERFRRER